MGRITSDAFQKAIILLLIDSFKSKTIWGKLRFQKTLYLFEKYSDVRPFDYYHTHLGHFSHSAKEELFDLKKMGYIN